MAELTFLVKFEPPDLLIVGFGAESHNDRKVMDAKAQLDALAEAGELRGELIKINGPASLPVAMTIAHALGHRYQAVACYDPKPGHYVVAVAHGGKYAVGDVIPG